MLEAAEQLSQLLLALPQSLMADIDALMFQKVVGDEPHRAIPFQRCPNVFAAEPALQLVKAKRRCRILLPADQLAVENAAGRHRLSDIHKLWEALVDQFFPSAPEVDAGTAMDQLTADPIPLPLQLPIVHRCLPQPIRLQWTCEIKGVRRAPGTVLIRGCFGGELSKALHGRFKPAHQSLHHQALFQFKRFCNGAADQAR